MKSMRRQLSIKNMNIRDEPFGYEELHSNYDENLLGQQLGSLSMPSDIDDYDANVNTNTGFGYDSGELPMGNGLSDPVVDLDRMIAETSARWKCTVTAIVSNTVTANTTNVSSATLSSNNTNPTNTTTGTDSITYFTNINSGSSTGSPQPQSAPVNTPALSMESPIVSASTSSGTAPQSLVGMQSTARRPQIVSRQNSTGTHCSVMSIPTAMEHQVIEQQQAEIHALHAAIQAQHRQQRLQQSSMNGFHRNRPTTFSNITHQQQFHQQQYAPSHGRFVPGMTALNENSVTLIEPNNHNSFSIVNYGNIPHSGCVPFNPYTVEEKIDCAPVEHIEVHHHDASFWQDDLTVWSGFNTVTGNPDSPSCAEPSKPTCSSSPDGNPRQVLFPYRGDDRTLSRQLAHLL
jgi:hypothetical protein